jgi:N6-L-threonylcarbamoyladenine synthase
MNNPLYVGIDTSNYTTSLALCDGAGQVIANLKAPLPVKEGERGLRQSDAVFAHVKNLPSLMVEMKAVLASLEGGASHIRGIGFSATPRRSADSYMPCFLAGKVAASAIDLAADVPVCDFSHQEGHVMAALYSAGVMEEMANREFVAFHVSGGTTDVLYVRPDKGRFDIEMIGTSLDLHAGQAVDRVGVALGLKFPCGKELEALAATCDEKIPKPRICVKGLDCHLSGLENLALSLYEKTGDRALVAAYTLDFIGQTLVELSAEVRRRYPDIPMVYAGGVMSNRRIQTMVGKRFKNTYFSEPAFSADNAAGIALLCRRALQHNQ